MTDQKAETIKLKPCAERARRDALIRAEYGKGRMTAAQIAAELGMPRLSVISRARALGLAAKHGSDQHRWRLSASRGISKPSLQAARPLAKIRQPAAHRAMGQAANHINPTSPMDRGRPRETLRVVEAVAKKHAPKNRMCAWREYEGNGRSMPCCEPAVRGQMWCESHLEKVRALRESA